ncbi:hypothetical protein A3B02_01550 [Candidatus Roizmanbacteria bacterium RIFCSPLOWO2_01_FULL_42_14]|uniref:Solute-binding protein family 5 domain-containing protein n=4 Tax=Candidatus Roizmaniibacteriota TaxID=1752723 RepID=A0A1F7JVR1_9BACT|nr:MAG: hypothetical protein A3D08_01440 [Candidatus Roizmanbacteria bacterium RIFCSPHIGHO2_02_FULL_43_11]OGK37991.1 MAG: hypothetical protein A3F32_01340 [Candidatus Roizmanbacteria bacterium RIFCSPHIGHO2_12_FULL_42_10]OGK51575.1 MAG: hypothetical protein A3B02_01550 [Candidatus Roizmanbacteria bacterium RIFCSPLOWO2_01_FULL_42_14]OGK59697.1 MAG: hypothetical protein A3I56_00885 [Candidatus Roizmanbacteria bacterium RIFCSPLOWO2_02_FULL_43_10]
MNLHRQVRHYYWLFTEFVQKHAALLVVSFIAAFLLIIALLNFFPFFSSRILQRREIIGMSGQYSLREIPLSVRRQVSNPLIMIDQNGEIQPLLANSWELLDGGKTYRFHLRNDLFWADGKRFTSKGISYSFPDVTMTPVDDYTIDFTLKAPLNIFPIYLTQPVIKQPFVGIGALYRVESYKHKKNVITSINLAPNKPNLPYRIYRFYSSEEDLINAYKKGEITQFITQDQTTVAYFKPWRNTKVTQTIDYSKIMALFFNNQSGALQEREIRKAFAYATPSFPERGDHAKGPIPPTSWAYYSGVKEYPYNEEHARELLKKNVTSTVSASFKLYTFADTIDFAGTLKKYYQKIGAHIDVKVAQQKPPDEFDMFLAIWNPPDDPDQFYFWYSTQEQTNITKFKSLKIDKLLEDGRKVLNVKQRQSIYKDFQKAISDELPAYFMYHPYEYIIERR